MIYAVKGFIKSCICIAFVLFSVDVNAQVSLIQNTIDKLESYKNFSYQSVYKQKDYTSDTLVIQYKDIFSKAPEDKTFGCLFSMETLVTGNNSPWTDFYNGQNLIRITPADSTYELREIKASAIGGSLPGRLNWIKSFSEKKPSKIVKASDTTINAITCSHLIVNTYDTIINKEHYYTRMHVFIDKLSGVPNSIITQSRNTSTGDGITNFYSENRYFDYKFNQDNNDIASMTIPKGFHPPKERPTLPLLSSRTVAPDWTLYAADGKKMSLTQMKGKGVLLDFYFIGCIPCMQAIKPLNNLYEKYRNQNVVIASITERDSKKSVLAFEKNYHIKYPGYVNAADVVKSYHVNAFPTFYFIDKEGKIANVIDGYSDGFEGKVTSIIDNLLNK
jgi:peroxiredoxin